MNDNLIDRALYLVSELKTHAFLAMDVLNSHYFNLKFSIIKKYIIKFIVQLKVMNYFNSQIIMS